MAQQTSIRPRLKIFGRAKDYRAHKAKTKGILVKGEVDCSLIRMWYKKPMSWRDERLTWWNLVQGGDCWKCPKFLISKNFFL